MARSLTVKHEETLSVSPLFAGFVMIAVGVLLISAATGWSEPAVAAAPAASAQQAVVATPVALTP